ncbi:hypothetical protein [Fibrobacter sp.]|uniref:hypothetical protein n=1 Tax=Fibrobacter sp. TaxID=35828 RepID=UPI0025BAAC9A|nr:hypothetical protein [Fibrobacter sp.]MCI6438146.1 hypothetical protein [Fibrobacter sp.]MDD7497315.1 hypothetical protein [Fibrobacter sp.]MDY5723284.1 hypothetical protein [Fibrobacter sp.]
MKKWVWHIGLTTAVGALIAACTAGKDTAGSSLETENSVAVVLTVQKGDGTPAARTRVFVRPSDFLAGANSLTLSDESDNLESPVVETDSAAGILNAETDDQGRLNLPRLKPGSYTIEARENTLKDFKRVEVTDSSLDSVSLKVAATGSMSGQVFLPEDVRSVTVGIQGFDYFVQTDSLGNFVFENLPAGNFSVVGFVYSTYEVAGLDGTISSYDSFLPVGARTVHVSSEKTSENVKIGVAADTVSKDTVPKDSVVEDTVDVYPVVLFEDFEDSTYGWYTTVSQYASAKLGTDSAGLDREGLAAHFVYTNDSNYNWVLMGKTLRGVTDLSELDSVVFWARGSEAREDSAQWISFSFDVQMDSVDLEKNGYENGKAWVHMTLDTAWTRYVVTPEDVADTVRIGGNIGWEKVKDHVTNLNIFGGGVGGPFEIWVDDITIYGVKDVD